jgi:hypothetical protein
MKTLTKTLVGTVAAGAMAMTSAAPAFARDRDRDNGISTGEVIAGAVILGGIAAVLASSGNNDSNYRDRNYRGYDDGYNRGYNRGYDGGHSNQGYNRGNGRAAVERCVRAAENDARRGGYRYANVTEIRDVDNTRYGWRVKGRIDVQGARGYRGDSGRFTCDISRGRVVDLDYSGIRGLR